MTDPSRHDHPPAEHGHVAALLAELGHAPLPRDVELRLLTALDAGLPRRAPRRRRLRLRGLSLPRVLVPVAGLAAVALVVAIGFDPGAGGGSDATPADGAGAAPAAALEVQPVPESAAAATSAATAAAGTDAIAMDAATEAPMAGAASSAAAEAGTAPAAAQERRADVVLAALQPFGGDDTAKRSAGGADPTRADETYRVPVGTGRGAVLRHYAALLDPAGWRRAAGSEPGVARWRLDGAVIEVDARSAPTGRYRVAVRTP